LGKFKLVVQLIMKYEFLLWFIKHKLPGLCLQTMT
jgi:hypothetical protein